ncbi:hypothetical protein LHP98_12865 [Rhodobacter sp. Har01]|uniref:hypothetical protein n=1 Tax=Rhodobacter sp. Har01 TaxID=2883999 RepID=UPI001D086470|nr:hypothetical protein [Rhodobacter sp. Har01]MCB6179016.1 hypothetical protein [Rhodobacter sp. Har01]
MRCLGQRIGRAALTAVLAASLVLAGWSALRIIRDPLLQPFADRTADEFVAALDRQLARTTTPDLVADRLRTLLAETPRNWIAIDAVTEIATDRAIVLPADLIAARQAAWDQDHGYLHSAGACVVCTLNAARCTIQLALICNTPVALTPIGDLIGIGRAGYAAASGTEVDRIDFALSAIGLGATLALAATGGTSLTLKAGASLLKLARKMRLLSPRLMALIADAAQRGIRWERAAQWDSLTDPARLLNVAAVAPVAAVASDLGRINHALDTTRTLHLMRYIDGPDDARHLADAAQVLGPRSVGMIEVLGKSRFLRAAVRWTDEALALVAGIVGLLVSLGMALASALQGLIARRLRRALRQPSR